MLAKFKATVLEVNGYPSEEFYFEFHVNVMGVEVKGLSKILRVSLANPSDYTLMTISADLLEKAKLLWPIRFEEKAYVELSPNVV